MLMLNSYLGINNTINLKSNVFCFDDKFSLHLFIDTIITGLIILKKL